MTVQSYKAIVLKIDNASGSLTDMTCSFSNATLQFTQGAADITSLCDDQAKAITTVTNASLTLAGFVNSTTDAAFGPLLEVSTSITKTWSFYDGVKYYTGEAWVTDIQFGGQAGQAQTFSATLTVDGAINQTSVAPA